MVLTAASLQQIIRELDRGTSFPGSPASGDIYFRTDVRGGMRFRYDGTRWVSEQLLTLNLYSGSLTADASQYFPFPHDYQTYLDSWDVSANVSTTAVWVVYLYVIDTEGDINATAKSYSTSGQTGAQTYAVSESIGVVVDATAGHGANLPRVGRVTYDETTGTATFIGSVAIHYRLIAT